jgi:dihydrofolate reductase
MEILMNIKCSVFIATSLDGFIARKDGAIDWLVGNEQAASGEDYGYKAFFDSVDTLVMGRNSYDLVLTFPEWPYADKRVVVLSNGTPAIPERLASSVTIMAGTPTEVVQRLYADNARHLYIDGGKTIQGFLSAGLIDEMTITRIPILLGDGIPLFGQLKQDIHLEHIQTRAYKNGFVQSQYNVIRVAKNLQ